MDLHGEMRNVEQRMRRVMGTGKSDAENDIERECSNHGCGAEVSPGKLCCAECANTIIAHELACLHRREQAMVDEIRELRVDLRRARQLTTDMVDHAYWVWSPDDDNDLESMSDNLAVMMTAGNLKAMLARAAK